jgi:hypothetical protein
VGGLLEGGLVGTQMLVPGSIDAGCSCQSGTGKVLYSERNSHISAFLRTASGRWAVHTCFQHIHCTVL